MIRVIPHQPLIAFVRRAVTCDGRLHYLASVSAEWIRTDGVLR
jgi:hypothetical protein